MNAEERIKRAFESVHDDGTPWRHRNAPVTVIKAIGRCVHMRLSGEPVWSDLADDLLGDGMPCSEFRLEGRDLYVRVKTDAQLEADYAAMDYDDAHDGPIGTRMPTHEWPYIEPVSDKPRKPAKRKTRGPLETAIADHIEASGEVRFMRRDLLADVRAALEKDGREVRSDSLARCLDTRFIGKTLDVVPDTDGEQLELLDEQ